jgi:hypothetical protein
MHKVTYKSLLLSLFILFLGAFGGWLLTRKMLDYEVGLQFLRFGVIISAAIFFSKLCIYFKAKKLLFFQILFIGGFGVDIAWFLSCLFLPLFWIGSISVTIKIAIMTAFLLICFGNVLLALRVFEGKWKAIGEAKFEEAYKKFENTVNWECISKAMKISAIIFIPGAPKKYSDLISVILFILLMLGFALRGAYPVFSMVSWAFPFSVCAACCLQMSSYHFAQAGRVFDIEKNKNITLLSS